MKIGTLLGIAALGGFYYTHRKRGGEMTLESMKETARGLFGEARHRARDLYTPGTNSQRMYDGDDADLRH